VIIKFSPIIGDNLNKEKYLKKRLEESIKILKTNAQQKI